MNRSVFVAALALSACTAVPNVGGTSTPANTGASTVSTSTSSSVVALVPSSTTVAVDLSSFKPSLAYLLVFQRTNPTDRKKFDDMIWDCMEKQGFKIFRGSLNTIDGSALNDVDPRSGAKHNQPFSVADAKLKGYRITTFTPPTKQSPLEEYLGAISDEERSVYNRALDQGFGKPDDPKSCMHDAWKALYADQAGTEINAPLDEVEARVNATPQVVTADKQWTVCMADKGFSFATHAEAVQSINAEYQIEQPKGTEAIAKVSVREIATAVADEECYLKYVFDAEVAVRPAIEQKVLEENPWLVTFVDKARVAYKKATKG